MTIDLRVTESPYNLFETSGICGDLMPVGKQY